MLLNLRHWTPGLVISSSVAERAAEIHYGGGRGPPQSPQSERDLSIPFLQRTSSSGCHSLGEVEEAEPP